MCGAARARGIAERAIVWGHIARNVAPQLATAALNRLGMLFTGAVLVETLFAWPGLGRLLSSAILNRDHPVLLGAFGLIVAMVIRQQRRGGHRAGAARPAHRA